MYYSKIGTDIKQHLFILLSGHDRLISDEISQGTDDPWCRHTILLQENCVYELGLIFTSGSSLPNGWMDVFWRVSVHVSVEMSSTTIVFLSLRLRHNLSRQLYGRNPMFIQRGPQYFLHYDTLKTESGNFLIMMQRSASLSYDEGTSKVFLNTVWNLLSVQKNLTTDFETENSGFFSHICRFIIHQNHRISEK
jgi:hypothetical protein